MFSSCYECSDKSVTCTGYTEKGFSTWFPYAVNDKVIFSSGAAKDTFTIRTVYVSNPYQDRVSARHPFCNAEKSITSVEVNNNGAGKLFISNGQFNDVYASQQSVENLQIYLRGGGFAGKGISDTGIMRKDSDNQTSQFFSSLQMGSITYTNVQVIMADTLTAKNSRPYKIWISKNHGIIAYEEYPGKNLWLKQ